MTVVVDLAELAARILPPLRVRAGTPDDIERDVAFHNRFARPAQWVSLEMVRRFESYNPQPKRLALFVEDERGEIVAAGGMSDGGSFARKDGSFSGGLRVAPEHRRRGIGTALLERLEAHVRSHGAPRIRSSVRGDEPDGVRFAERHGYRETNRRFHSYLDVHAFDASRLEDPEAIAARAGVRLVAWDELERERAADIDALQRELYEFELRQSADIPRPEPMQMPPYEAVRDIFFAPGGFDHACTIVALRDGRIVSETVTEQRSPGVAYTDFTGTAREERGKGLALALKLRAIDALRRQGARLFGTTNDEQNAAMRGINARLGYVPDPPMIELEKKLA